MFKTYFVTATLLWVLLMGVNFFILKNSYSSKAQLAYQNLIHFNDQAKKEQAKRANRQTEQTRYHVSKQIFYKKGNQRLQMRLTSDQSDLVYNQKENESELVEHFKGLTCVIQEQVIGSSDHNLEEAKQYIRTLNARQAVHSYKTGQLLAEEVKIAHFLIPGDQWPLSLESYSPLIQGESQRVKLTLFKEFALKAEGFQASIRQW